MIGFLRILFAQRRHFNLRELLLECARHLPGEFGVQVRSEMYSRLLGGLGTKATIGQNVTFAPPQNMILGSNANIMAGSGFFAEDGSIRIGNRFSCNTNVYISAGQGTIEIGDNVSIGPNTVLRAADHEFARTDVPINQQGHRGGRITIEEDVWIGANATITQNVTIGRGAIVGAGAVVTRDIEPYCISAGVPARQIGDRRKASQIGEKKS